MNNASLKSFGVIIAFLLPGFIAIWGLSLHNELIAVWFRGSEGNDVSVGGMLFSTIVALGLGLIASTIRWFAIDTLHHWTGIKRPSWNFRRLQANIAAYQLLEENHYRFYQFYGNSLCALIYAWISWKIADRIWFDWVDLGIVFLIAILYLGSRDTLRKYYLRVNHLLDSKDS